MATRLSTTGAGMSVEAGSKPWSDSRIASYEMPPVERLEERLEPERMLVEHRQIGFHSETLFVKPPFVRWRCGMEAPFPSVIHSRHPDGSQDP